MKFRTFAALALLAFTASGCVTAAEQRAADETRCSSYGFRRNTDAFANCLLSVDLDRSAVRRYQLETAFGPRWYGYRYGYW
ncbi:hypothetical protein [Bosea sp. BK604]|uniref:hypothetical protein n=1 Tax=Bosea sp. BK604 TaxID=2512180 RepID=UPI00104D6B8D|nr:hypothetical protein [Bosea sp. BK604]TCR64053.1 hypothetical protein EV560_107139 [Bosea sp. BK604]